MIDWEAVGLLLNAPKKKYIKKVVEYSACLHLNPKAVPPTLTAPITQDMTTDLQTSTAQVHNLLRSLAILVKRARELGFEEERLQGLMEGRVDEGLAQILVETLTRIRSCSCK